MRKLSRGMLSSGRIAAPQAGQCDPGQTTDSPRGVRWMTTFRKLPMTAPQMVARRVSKSKGIIISTLPRYLTG
jgi:hypothetical protein